MKGISHPQSKETREKLSAIRSLLVDRNRSGGFKDVGWYNIKNICGKEFTVRGTWELTVAQILNEKNIVWVRNQTLKYVKDEIKKSYNPDFYLPTTNEYIEVKGYYSDIDKEKMKLVLKYNPTVRIYMINQYDYPLVKEKKLWLEERMILSLDNCVK